MSRPKTTLRIPLFPLSTVLFPGMWLYLRIFEPRYLDMVSWCLRQESGFGVCLISIGSENDINQEIHKIGTLAFIRDWYTCDDGLLGLQVEGMQRFRVLSHHNRADRLMEAEISLIQAEPYQALPAEFAPLRDLLQNFFEHPGSGFENQVFHGDDSTWVGNRLAELLPMTLPRRQLLLEMEDPIERLRCLRRVLEELNIRY
jgi:uncharacterized protein